MEKINNESDGTQYWSIRLLCILTITHKNNFDSSILLNLKKSIPTEHGAIMIPQC